MATHQNLGLLNSPQHSSNTLVQIGKEMCETGAGWQQKTLKALSLLHYRAPAPERAMR